MTTPKKYLFPFTFLLLIGMLSCNNEEKKKIEDEAVEETEETIDDPNLVVPETDGPDQDVPVEDLIQVESPQPNAVIGSPLEIQGMARGIWYFEADFPVYLLDENEEEIAQAIATAKTDWMTEDWVEFEASMEFDPPASGKGFLLFEKSNPSGRQELDNSFRIPVEFK